MDALIFIAILIGLVMQYRILQKVKLDRRFFAIMGRLDAIKAALDAAGATAADEAVQVNAHFEALRNQVATLQATIDDLVAGQVTDEEITALADQATALATTVEAIDTEGDVAPEPEPEPEPTPEPTPEPEPPVGEELPTEEPPTEITPSQP